MKRLQVLFIKKTMAAEPYKRISHIGGKHGNYYWLHAINVATSNYLNGTFSYYIDINGGTQNLIIQRTKDNELYFKTKCGEQQFDLLTLEEFTHSEETVETKELLQLIQSQKYSPNKKKPGSISICIPDHVAYEIELVSGERFIKQLNEDEYLNNNSNTSCGKEDSKIADVHNTCEDLSVLSGSWTKGTPIMSKNEYNQVVEYYKYTTEYKELPSNIKRVARTQATNEFIRYTFYLLWKTSKSIDRKLATKFLHAVFEQFSNTEITTTDSKFSTKFNGYEDFKVNRS